MAPLRNKVLKLLEEDRTENLAEANNAEQVMRRMLVLGVSLAILLAAASVGAVGALTWAVVPRGLPAARLPDEEEEARRLAEGRGAVLEIVRAAGAATGRSIEVSWGPEPPPDLDEWVASLVADGTLLARALPDGTAEFSLAPERTPDLRVTVDEVALERAVARREAEIRDGEERRP